MHESFCLRVIFASILLHRDGYLLVFLESIVGIVDLLGFPSDNPDCMHIHGQQCTWVCSDGLIRVKIACIPV